MNSKQPFNDLVHVPIAKHKPTFEEQSWRRPVPSKDVVQLVLLRLTRGH